MSSPPPLRETNADFADLVASLRRREPDAALLEKVMAIPDRSPPPSPAASPEARGLGRWLVVGACVLGVAGLGWSLHESRSARAPHLVEPAAAKTVEAPAMATPVEAAGAVTGTSVDDLPPAPTAERPSAAPSSLSPSVAAPSATVQPRTGSASTFHEELAIVEAARSALARGDATTSLRELARYDARFRSGALVAEADMTRIEALLAVGRTDEARALGERFARANPASPYADRVRSLLDKAAARGASPNANPGKDNGR